MAHEIGSTDRVVLKDESAWHGLGTVIKDDLSAFEAAQRFGFLWPVGQWRLQAIGPNGETLDVDTHVANVRELDNDGNKLQSLLGVVGSDYSVCQNRELAEFTDALAQTGRVTIESCGTIRDGKRIWFLGRGDSFKIGGTDEVFPYVLVSNGHDGTQAIRVTPTTIRVVCSNTLHMVIPANEFGERPETAAITIRHTGKIADKLEQARRAMEYYGDTLRRNVEMFEAMQAQRVSREQAVKLFADTYAAFWEVATPDDLRSPDKRIREIAENRAERMRKASDSFMQRWADEQSALGIGSTIWSAFNAMTGFVQHDKTARGKDDAARVERRIESNLFGVNATRTHEVLASALALAS
jgi:phage/plasmid-like protein (TIGR03299 family)